MLILGLNLSLDASAALVTEERILCRVQEERLDRVKFSYTFPKRAIAAVMRLTGVEPGVAGRRRQSQAERDRKLAARLRSQFDLDAPLHRYDHHAAHVASADFTSGFENALVVTRDGAGDNLSGSVSLARGGQVERTIEIPASASVGAVYSEVVRSASSSSAISTTWRSVASCVVKR